MSAVSISLADAPLALAAFLFVWKLTLEPVPANDNSRPALRLFSIAAAAVLVTFCVLDYGIDHYKTANLARVPGKNGDDASHHRGTVKVTGISGFESIILWPAPEKTQIVAPRPADISPLATRTAKPLVIHFDGAYWYFQPPDKRPGPAAHHARGNPLTADIGANNTFPLTMEAVQNLSASIRIARYREIQVSIENRDNISGVVSLGVLLTDNSAPGKPSLSLHSLPVLTSQAGPSSFESAPVEEVLRFPIPEHTTIRKFNQIALLFLPDLAHFEVGPKIAIQQFTFIPR